MWRNRGREGSLGPPCSSNHYHVVEGPHQWRIYIGKYLTRAPRSHFLNSHAVSRNNWPNNRLMPPVWRWRPPLENPGYDLARSPQTYRSKLGLMSAYEFFTVCTKLAEMAILYSKDLTTAKKKLPPVGLDLMLQIITGLGVQCLTI